MTQYFAIAAGLLVPALIATALTGAAGWSGHLHVGLFTAVLAIGAHTLLILFMIVTGRVLREAIRSRQLPGAFLAELNEFFARKKAYPLAILAAFSVVVAAVLGYAHRGFGISPAWHWLVGVGAVAFNLWAVTAELRALTENQRLLDRAAAELDRIDSEREARGEPTFEEEVEAGTGLSARRLGVTLAAGAWLPYLYWALIVWRGDFSEVSIHPWIEVSALGVLLALKR